MLWWVFVFLGIAIIASLRDLGGLASTAAGIAQVLFFVFLIVFLVALVMGSVRHRRPAGDLTGDREDAAIGPVRDGFEAAVGGSFVQAGRRLEETRGGAVLR